MAYLRAELLSVFSRDREMVATKEITDENFAEEPVMFVRTCKCEGYGFRKIYTDFFDEMIVNLL